MFCKHCKQKVTPGTTHRCRAGTFQVPSSLSTTSSGDDSGDFLLSMAIGAATDSTLIGGVVGGDFLGAAIGDALFGDD